MFTEAELIAIHRRVLDRMLAAGWITSHVFKDGGAYSVIWSLPGAQRAILLRKIVIAYGLTGDDRAALALDKIARGQSLGGLGMFKGERDPVLFGFWIECVDALALHGDQDGLLILCHIVKGKAPDERTKFKFPEFG